MLQEELSLRASGGGGNSSSSRWKKTMTGARVCDSCRSSSSTVYCRADGSYLCTGCDSRVHGTACGGGDHHERVWVCESCQRAPADFLCKADAASLCAACDSYIHSANSLASRHHRVVILPTTFFNNSRNPVSAGGRRVLMGENHHEDRRLFDDEEEADSWLLLDNNCNGSKGGDDYNNDQNSNNGCSSSFLGAEVDDYLDLVEYNLICGDENEKPEYKRSSYIGGDDHHDSMVPMGEAKQEQELHIFELGLGYELNNKSYTHPPPNYQAAGYNNNSNNTSNLSHSLSASSMDVGVVPVETTTSSSTHHHDMTITLYSSVNPALQVLPAQPLSPVDREARVLRYREKKKTRKFEKTIRYASRKAYAETRPRIKGRFAKRVDVEVDRMFADTSSMMMQEDGNVGCGVVPSF